MIITLAIIAYILFFLGHILILRGFVGLSQEISKLKESLERANREAQEYEKRLGQQRDEIEKLKAESNQKGAKSASKDTELQQFSAEASKLKDDLQIKACELAAKEQEVQALTTELAKVKRQQESATIKAEELTAKENEIKRLSGEVERINSEKSNEIKRLTEELERTLTEQKNYHERLVNLKKAEPDILLIERSLDEKKKALHEIKLRLEESKMKVQLLNDKSKETAESIAQFAEGKEFEEFRKSIHLDEITQKYEDEIKDLKIKNMELEKTLKQEAP